MTTTSNTNEPGRDDATMRELLLSADRQEIEPPRDVLDGVRAKIHENTVRPALPVWATARRMKRAWFAATAAAAAVLIALFFSLQPSSIAWSQVAEAVRAMPCIHMREGKSQEMWISFSRNIAASRDGETIAFSDFRSGVQYEYDLQQKKLYRLSVADAADFKSVEGLFQAIFRGDAIHADNLVGPRLIKQRQRTVTEEGRRWILYELELGDPNDKDTSHTGSVVIRVDPETKRPERMTLTRGKEKVEVAFDYPVEGPANIYALGVPRDARVDDRTPSPELSRILKVVEQNRRDFGDYLAVTGENTGSLVRLIRCKGDKFRVDVGIGDTKHVASGAEMGKWWWEHGREILPEGSVLCDGRCVYEHSYVKPEPWWEPSRNQIRPGDDRTAAAEGSNNSRPYFVELLAYPRALSPENLTSAAFLTVRLDLKGENGPAGSVRVERLIGDRGGRVDRNAFHKEEFWLQPKYGYAVVKHVLSDCPEIDADPKRIEKKIVHEYDDFRQTPRGVWYPTVSRYKNAIQSESENKSGGIKLSDQVTHFYVDFTAQLPDELFSVEWKGDLLRGIRFALRDEKATSTDLGRIQPPGGVPLMPGGAGIEITPGAIERMRQRLEAAPAADLEKWVVELERITDKKLDGGLERQGCRTYFVTRMSVAFDGLKWNAKSADALFKRAQTMPATEAKAWKQAFETLLNEKFERAYVVPLVLVPVDALYEGEKYSVERAKTYLARMKQLTADDVSLWNDKVDGFGGTRLDAAINITLLDGYFENEKFQREKLKAAIGARRGR
jgi:hypothetical protein